jgi:nucleoside-diphosphate-sugar epimerase
LLLRPCLYKEESGLFVRILVTGGAGFIGSHLSERLLDDGHEVIAVDNLVTGSTANIDSFRNRDGFTFIEHDVIQPLPDLPALDRIYHLASPASPPVYQEYAIETMRVNSEGTRLLLELAEQNGARFFYASTSEIYGDPLEHPQREEYRGNVSTIGPRSMYDEAKRYGEAMCSAFTRSRGVETRIVRIFNTYGPRMDPEDGRVVTNFISQALRNEPITVYGDGTQTRSFQYVSDLVDGMVKLMESDCDQPVNIGNPEEYTMLQLAELVLELTGASSEVVHRPLPEDDPKQRRPDISLAKRELGWEPVVPVSDGLQRTIEYLRTVVRVGAS